MGASHKRTGRSRPPEAIRDPSGLNAAQNASPVCRPSIFSSRPVAVSQTRTVPSDAADTSRLLSGLKATEHTSWTLPANVARAA